MVAVDQFVHGSRSFTPRVLGILGLVIFAFTLGAHPALAIDWCSSDPVFTFQRIGTYRSQVVDVQVMVPLSALPLTEVTTLSAEVPVDVAGHVALSISTPMFPLEAHITSLKPRAGSERYPITFELLVPASTGSFPVRMIVSDTAAGTITIVDGQAGQKLETSIMVAP
ncbi:MAG: hypothetical protein M3R24_30395 [Chloroflexota bacterium]|nr:hypothetical protein [Chloroflexota bacterium]PLS83293.1 MAG: hypothetical protein CYG59_01685 [Chloroflexota bacterium]